jgi:hypothetical protein
MAKKLQSIYATARAGEAINHFCACRGGAIRSKPSVMKTLLRTNKYAVLTLGTIGCLLIFACKTETTKRTSGKVDIQDKRLVIHPYIKLLPAEEKKLDDVLRNHDKKLYRIATWKNGKVVKVRGDRPKAIKAEAAEAMVQGADVIDEQSVCPNLGCPTTEVTANQKRLLKDLGELLANH